MTVRILLRAIRIHQWAKNLLVFVPIVTSGSFLVVNDWINAVLLFIAFSFTASSIYITNDICDLAADRNHPRKSKRPFASGDLPISAGLLLCPILLLCGLSIGVATGTWLYLLSYVVLAIAYSAKAKTFPLVDVFILAALYMVRLFAGGEVTGHPVSMWLLAFSGFVFLGLALLKRVAELRTRESSKPARRGYQSDDLALLQQMGIAASFVSASIFALYVQSEEISARYAHPEILWIILPFILFWQCRMWLATHRGQMSDDPIVFAAKDWVSWLTCASITGVFVAGVLI